jgi:hypothetical protein
MSHHMKTILASRFASAAGFIAATSVALISVAYVPAVIVALIIGACLVVALLAFAWSDYQRKPSYRSRAELRATGSAPTQPAMADARQIWTYQTISA